MKKILPYVLMLALPMVALAGAGDIDMVPVVVTDTVTNIASATADTGTHTGKVYGWLDTIIIDLTGHTSPNIDIDIVAAGQMGSRTVFSINDIAADGVYPVRDYACTTVGVDFATYLNKVSIPLVGDVFTVSCYDSDSATGVNVNVYFVIKPVPGG